MLKVLDSTPTWGAVDSIDKIIIGFFNSGFNGAIPNWLGNFFLLLLSLLSVTIFAGLIGLERELNGHAAGFRTHLLVALGSAIIMYISLYGFLEFDGGSNSSRDPARLAAQVITGIGFLGAGTIVQTGTSIKGLTTATTIWMAMAIGLACGSGNFVVGAAAMFFVMLYLVSMRKFENFVARRQPIIMVVVPADKPMLKEIMLIADRYNININHTTTELASAGGKAILRLTLHCASSSRTTLNAFVQEVRSADTVLEVSFANDVV